MNEELVEAMQEPSDQTECHSTPSQVEEAIPLWSVDTIIALL